jgi:hypothetical protein
MPRVTFDTYRSRHDQLYQIWTENQELFSYISGTKKWEIHGYYLSSDNPSDEELRQHFQAVPIYDASYASPLPPTAPDSSLSCNAINEGKTASAPASRNSEPVCEPDVMPIPWTPAALAPSMSNG